MEGTKKGYSKFIRPATYILDLIAINAIAFLVLSTSLVSAYFHIFITLSWSIISLNVSFYEVFRYTKIIEILNKLVKQFFLYTILCYSFAGFYEEDTDAKTIFIYILVCLFTISSIKFAIYHSLKKFGWLLFDSIKHAIILGKGVNIENLTEVLENPDYGYRLVKRFGAGDTKEDMAAAFDFALREGIDELFVSLSDLSKTKINEFVEFSEHHLKTIKFVPENREIFDNNFKLDYYGYVPVLSINRTVLHEPITKMFKRTFDILFSLFVIVFVLSWLTPLLAILIKMESKGPVFFRQGRPGIDETEFMCFKYRSMQINKTTEKEASKNDPRVTRIGKFMRKTSIDELPQFLNVLLGDMSVVGPRPHLWSQNKAYGNRIKRYMVRHYVKPGITGLAQVRGFRGEIETDEDMINRIKYDVFYIENWSLILDLKIIAQTVINIFQGEEKAY
ncbi:exopolysaccharide biosynthesis polyprenyl glycosylphosphotransferase [Flavobacterium caeni]|uniref:Putative colanic acid biosysnthesis UDP-glucose lipid carrier transferase n=1 Tax=Flavobacterium caeni TaxID=490189 RepID=A0A1G5JAL4_9FLAO|nr:exopolysaccharide biosynthesis polyprenyl glycosylphosphotransferase [Flavobacterium caeni]SCY85385.1 putative colanic acid biosysnthesis UDP-glucose lipid carrier transferase [Flavobacterium caeni]